MSDIWRRLIPGILACAAIAAVMALGWHKTTPQPRPIQQAQEAAPIVVASIPPADQETPPGASVALPALPELPPMPEITALATPPPPIDPKPAVVQPTRRPPPKVATPPTPAPEPDLPAATGPRWPTYMVKLRELAPPDWRDVVFTSK